MKHYLIISLLSLLAIISHGYQYAVSDQEIFIPYIQRLSDPQLYPNDLLFEQSSVNTSIFYQIASYLPSLVDLQIIFFVGYLLFVFIFFDSIFRLAKIILGHYKLAYLSIMPFLLPKFIGGTATSTYETFFGYRLVGIIFLIYFLIFIFERKHYLATLTAATGFWFHPLSIIPNLLILPEIVVKTSKKKLFDLSITSAVFIILALPLLMLSTNTGKHLAFDLVNPDWLSIIKLRDDYLFPSLWSTRGWAALGLYITLIFVTVSNLKKEIRKIILLILATSLSVFIVNYFLLEIAKISLVAQFQLARSITPLAYIGLISSPIILLVKDPTTKVLATIAFVLLCLNLFNLFLVVFAAYLVAATLKNRQLLSSISPQHAIIILLSIIILHVLVNQGLYTNIREKFQYPKAGDDWIDIQNWAKLNTDPKEKFLTPPYQTGFRTFSHRPIVGDIKDGAVVMYSPTYAKKWAEIIQDLDNYDLKEKEDFLTLKNKYHFNYLVTSTRQSLDFDIAYKNRTYIIYII